MFRRGGFVWDPAGADRTLAQARTELRAGRRGLAREALAECRGDAAVRAQRSLLLGSVLAGTDLTETWVTEQPQDPDARLLYARVAMVRALRAAKAADPREQALGELAWQAAVEASRHAPADPTPWATLLAVARYRPAQDPDGQSARGGRGAGAGARACRAAAPPGLEVDGPWDLLAETQARRPWHREAFLRLLAYYAPRGEQGGAGERGDQDALWQVVSWAADASPPDSDPQLLPLAVGVRLARATPTAYARDAVEAPEAPCSFDMHHSLDKHHSSAAADTVQLPGIAASGPTETYAAYIAAAVYADWFPGIKELRFPPIADLSLLAYALDRSGLHTEACEVLAAMRPYATAFPWSLEGDPATALRAAYARSHLRPP